MFLHALRVAAASLAALTVASVSNAQSITTSTPNNGSGGVFLDLAPVGGALNFNAFATYYSSVAGTPVNVEVWTRSGTYVGFTTSNVGWTLSQTVTATSAGTATLSPSVSLTTPILLAAGTTTGVYLHAVTAGGGIRYNGTGALPPVITYSNADITLTSNTTRTGAVAFAGTQFTPRTFAGTIEYTPSNVNAMGACCSATAVCTFGSPADCANSGGAFSGDGTSCNPNLCTHRGACCSTATNACTLSNNGGAGCGANTVYQGDASTCSPNICPQGACCNDATGVCSLTAPTGCPSGSTYQSNGTTCTINPCPQPPPPANDTCAAAQALSLNVVVQATNAQATGDGTEGPGGTCYTTSPTNFNKAVWYRFTAPATTNYLVSLCGATFDTVLSVFSASGPTPCDALVQIGCDDDTCVGGTDNPLPGPGTSALASVVPSTAMTAGETYYVRVASWGTTNGAFGIVVQLAAGTTVGSCCVSTTCTLTDAANCTGTYTDGGSCTPSPCGAPVGVCCRGATCNTTVAQASCTGSGTAGANFSTSGAVCNAGVVSNTPCCFADYNKVGGITVNDIFDFLGDWFAGNPYANTGGNGTPTPLSVQNIFDFLTNWFTGGC